LTQLIQDEPINFLHYWHLIRHKLWYIVALTSLVTLLAIFWANSLPSMYSAATVILLKPEQKQEVSLEALLSDNSKGSIYFTTQKEIIQSRRILGELVEKLHLIHVSKPQNSDSWFQTMQGFLSLGGRKQEESANVSQSEAHYLLAVNRVRKQLNITNIPNSNLIKLSFVSTSPEMSAKLANTLAEIYIKDIMETRVKVSEQTTDWMRERATALKQQLQESEGRLQKFVEKSGLVNVGEGGQQSLTAQELTDLTTKRMQARARLMELSLLYGAKHPKIIAAKSELEAADRAFHLSQSRLRVLGRKGARLQGLQHEVDSNRHLYETFLNKLKEADQAKTMKTEMARIVDPAVVPLSSSKPNRKQIVVMALFMSFMLAVGMVILLDFLDTTIRSPDDVEPKLGLPILGLLPLVRFKKSGGGGSKLREMNNEEHRRFTESMRTIRTSITLSALDNPHKVVLVTSSVPGEGKSTVAENLAITMGKMERLLLIDCDLRKPSVFENFGISEEKQGLSDLVVGAAEFKDCITRNEEYGIDILHAGTRPPNPLELLSSKRFKIMISSFENHYDRIIIDSPPVHAVSDPLVLAQEAKAVVYVVQSDSTPENTIKKGLNRLEKVGAPVIGVILNQVNVNRTGADFSGLYDEYDYAQ